MVARSEASKQPEIGLPTGIILIGTLWLQLYASCIYGWKYGDYYSYGWYVPPLVFWFFFRIRNSCSPLERKALQPAVWVGACVLLVILLTCIRVVQRVDPRWTLPLWIQASVVIGATVFAIWRFAGPAAIRRVIPILLFACSAIPLPSVLERFAVSALTSTVISSSALVLGWLGRPVHAIGDQLGRMGEVVQVTEGCSGIKSAQSFLMVALFFGEWMVLTWSSRCIMIAAGLLTAWALNVVRATSLAWIRFEHGDSAFERAHDTAGLLAFTVGSLILLGVSRILDERRGMRKIRTHVVKGPKP